MPISTRTLSGEDLIQLPRFDAMGAVAVGEQLVGAASVVPELPRAIRVAKESLETNLASLRAAVAARLARAAAHPADVVDADRALDLSWTALHDWLNGFAKLPGAQPAQETLEARALLAELYPDGLSFVMLPYELEWDQSDLRLARITGESLGERIAALGGRVFIEALSKAHASYGKLLGLPRPARQEDAAPSLHEALDGFISALRVYALKVTAHVEMGEPQTAVLSKALLEPLMTWEGKAGATEGETTLH
jgi:hypothetical protein